MSGDGTGGVGKSIVIPACNEEHRIRSVLMSYSKYFPDDEIIVVANGCSDGTVELTHELSKDHPRIRILDFTRRLGKGGAVLQGLTAASGSAIGFVDADQSISPEEVGRLFGFLEDSDAAIASRWSPESIIPVKQPLMRRLASRCFNMFARIFFDLPFSDTQCGAKVFRSNAVKGVLDDLRTRGFEFDVELLWRLRRRGCVVKEVPVTWKHCGGSSLRLSSSISMLLSLIRLRLGLLRNDKTQRCE